MKAASHCVVRSIARITGSLSLLCVALALPCVASPYGHADRKPAASTVKVTLNEWKVQLTPANIPAGPVVFEVINTGTIAHALELEGRRLEQRTAQIRPGASSTLKLDLHAGSYEAYCPVGKGSHKMLGMMSHLMVGNAQRASATSDDESMARR
jgi:hypothetical protein